MLRLDPWAAEYDGSIQVADDEDGANVDVGVEASAWLAISPPPAPRPPQIAFVDGVRRVEHRLLVSDRDRTVFGLLGSYGVGAALVEAAASATHEATARVAHETIGRAAVTAGGLTIAPFSAAVRAGSAIVFEPRTEAQNTPLAPVAGLQTAMREAEGRLAGRLAAEVEVVFQDGPLSFLTAGVAGRVVGVVKRLQRQYLDPAHHVLLPRLGVGERTPLFLVGGREPRYSWYLRIAFGRAIEAALTGVVRAECPAARGLAEARELADLSARELPRFASDAARDPRAPQNLYPVGGLEARLKHLLGDPAVVRHAIEAQLTSEVTA
jgi:uncharacterized protein